MRQDGGAALSRVTVRLAAVLRQHANGQSEVAIDVAGDKANATIADVLDALAAAHPAVGRRLRDEAGEVRRHVNVFVGPDNVRDLDGLDTEVPDGAEVSVMPAVSGG